MRLGQWKGRNGDIHLYSHMLINIILDINNLLRDVEDMVKVEDRKRLIKSVKS